MFRDSPESWSAYIKGEVHNFGYMVARTSFFHAIQISPGKLNCHQILTEMDVESRSLSVPNMWRNDLQGELQATKSAEIKLNLNFKISPPTGAKNGIQQTRRLSLEESILVNHMAQIRPPIPKFNEGPLDLKMKNSPPIKRPSASLDFDKPIGNSNGTVDLFNLLSFDDDKKNISTTPSSWTTFD
ncbi:uncharacterized protein LOC123911248 [Trifolium pratense]|uniref:uncharacterized protein LOC123911248 n=2 Tax=Trifolium pratense TaxID=57577 RepID=UPI001E690738|nr:uncharacterized protein LOC123911248 [Trifolium pratense]XP_045818580.1 uncharacterized protein LOC123911248 [Trifolium pratense]XP_045818581.1 uncharacterized protein LOC123911248 [Trifolium pratense]XP_045818582.1 uncharacterized protein LOC123911248 [Trifolium pratense]